MNTYPVFTIRGGRATPGATVEVYQIGGVDVKIPAIVIGEEGRGRKLGVLPVDLPPDQYRIWGERGEVTITAARITQTRSGKPKLIAAVSADDRDAAIVVFRTHIGFRGSNTHTGDRTGWKCQRCNCASGLDYPAQDKPEVCPECGAGEWDIEIINAPFHGEVIAEGCIAEGMAGRAGSGSQIVALVPRNVVLCTAYSGRLYGEPREHYHTFDGEKIISLTIEERQASDLF